jgi:hypothetical protein
MPTDSESRQLARLHALAVHARRLRRARESYVLTPSRANRLAVEEEARAWGEAVLLPEGDEAGWPRLDAQGADTYT